MTRTKQKVYIVVKYSTRQNGTEDVSILGVYSTPEGAQLKAERLHSRLLNKNATLHVLKKSVQGTELTKIVFNNHLTAKRYYPPIEYSHIKRGK